MLNNCLLISTFLYMYFVIIQQVQLAVQVEIAVHAKEPRC